jgi:hypothetical protein
MVILRTQLVQTRRVLASIRISLLALALLASELTEQVADLELVILRTHGVRGSRCE